jgi:uncharacterized protein (TIGR02145 family)
MKKILMYLVSTVFAVLCLSSAPMSESIQNSSTVAKEIKIGSQIWMAENLNVEHFKNGDPILHARTKGQWTKAGKKGQPAYCYYGFDKANGLKFGKLYNWHAVNDPRGLAPEGWHVPTDEEWKQLSDELGGQRIAGMAMKSTTDWKGSGSGNNNSGFNGQPGGFRNADGVFYFMLEYGKWWSTTEGDRSNAWCSYLYHGNTMSLKYYLNKSYGLSVRCVKN